MEVNNVAPSNSKEKFVIHVKQGVFLEYVNVRSNKINIVLMGDVENLFRPKNEQAAAFCSNVEFTACYRCRFVGYEDTLYVHSGQQFYRECGVYGTIDFVFCNAVVEFQKSRFYPRRPIQGQSNTITAQTRSSHATITGYSISFKCNITNQDTCEDGLPIEVGKLLVGRLEHLKRMLDKSLSMFQTLPAPTNERSKRTFGGTNPTKVNYVVASDGSGNYRTIMEANNAAQIFQKSSCYTRRPIQGQSNTITAQARRSHSPITGFAMQGCKFSPSEDLRPVKSYYKTSLVRSWMEFSTTVILTSYIDDMVEPVGWLTWEQSNPPATIYYGEYMNYGSGANTKNRCRSTFYDIQSILSATIANQDTCEDGLPTEVRKLQVGRLEHLKRMLDKSLSMFQTLPTPTNERRKRIFGAANPTKVNSVVASDGSVIEGKGFVMRDITVENSSGPKNEQVAAFCSNAEFMGCCRCSFVGYEDTLYAHSGEQFYREC
ncbi:hypothetical protein H6P81_002061 [Aristolochia fimbriata]|uniref:Pectinesterase catalytic domain-containing protein n=1 Tax=Aristolochia fimbriata TaxID=158543 RepID=A0AAV7F8Y4_ARIFI|nr:hypothetical protein H6P81_002061 [Aristolochia fimbriata]